MPPAVDDHEPRGRIVRTEKDGRPILWTYVPEMPPVNERATRPWLTVLAWQYDGSAKNGMPDDAANRGMLSVDDALRKVEKSTNSVEVYRRIGDDLREFVLYIRDRDEFLAALNDALADQPTYPLDITFYEDTAWSDFQQLIDDLSEA